MTQPRCKCKGIFGTSYHHHIVNGWKIYCTDCGKEGDEYYKTLELAIKAWNIDEQKHVKYHAYIGRWQSPHLGHRWLIDQNLSQGKPVLILIRDVPADEDNPFTAIEVKEMLVKAFREEYFQGLVAIQIIPDIASVNYGRGVGYDVVCHEEAAPPEIKAISATEIRRQIRAGEEGWRSMVMPGVEKWLENKFNDS